MMSSKPDPGFENFDLDRTFVAFVVCLSFFLTPFLCPSVKHQAVHNHVTVMYAVYPRRVCSCATGGGAEVHFVMPPVCLLSIFSLLCHGVVYYRYFPLTAPAEWPPPRRQHVSAAASNAQGVRLPGVQQPQPASLTAMRC